MHSICICTTYISEHILYYIHVFNLTTNDDDDVKAIFDSLSACGVDVVALKRAIAFGLLRSRAQAYRVIYDAVKTPRSDVDYSLSPPPRSSVRAACARTQVTFGPATPAPAPVDRPMDTG